MQFIEKVTDSEIQDWISDNGQYHIIKYPESNFNAFFKPVGWKNFGQSCQLSPSGIPMQYASKNEAQIVCEKHFEKYGNNPGQWDRIN